MRQSRSLYFNALASSSFESSQTAQSILSAFWTSFKRSIRISSKVAHIVMSKVIVDVLPIIKIPSLNTCRLCSFWVVIWKFANPPQSVQLIVKVVESHSGLMQDGNIEAGSSRQANTVYDV